MAFLNETGLPCSAISSSLAALRWASIKSACPAILKLLDFQAFPIWSQLFPDEIHYSGKRGPVIDFGFP